MSHHTAPLSPQQRLAHSREALLRHMGHGAPQAGASDHSDDDHADDGQVDASASTWDLAKQVAGAWWQGHPAHLAVNLAKPVLQTYAEKKPLQLLGIAAGIGAAVVILRPWRLMSLTGVLLATLKSTEVSSLVKSLIPGSKPPGGYE
jgi:hypothetical protein